MRVEKECFSHKYNRLMFMLMMVGILLVTATFLSFSLVTTTIPLLLVKIAWNVIGIVTGKSEELSNNTPIATGKSENSFSQNSIEVCVTSVGLKAMGMQEVMVDAVRAEDGKTYSLAAIQGWFQTGKRTSPLSGLDMGTQLVPDMSLRQMVQRVLGRLQCE